MPGGPLVPTVLAISVPRGRRLLLTGRRRIASLEAVDLDGLGV